jgi:hypothetical protein
MSVAVEIVPRFHWPAARAPETQLEIDRHCVAGRV